MSIKRKQELCLDAIERCFSMAHIAYARVIYFCHQFEATNTLDHKDAMLLDAWSFVDVVKRLRSVLQNTPGLKKGKKLQDFLAATEKVPDFRNHVQHIEDKTMAVAATGRPILGSFSWCVLIQNGKQVKINGFIPGTAAVCKEMPLVNPAGLKFYADIDHFSMNIEDNTINLSEMSRLVGTFGRDFEKAKKNASERTIGSGETIKVVDLDSACIGEER